FLSKLLFLQLEVSSATCFRIKFISKIHISSVTIAPQCGMPNTHICHTSRIPPEPSAKQMFSICTLLHVASGIIIHQWGAQQYPFSQMTIGYCLASTPD